MQLLNSPFRVGGKWKNADNISFFVTRKCQKSEKLMKTDENSYY